MKQTKLMLWLVCLMLMLAACSPSDGLQNDAGGDTSDIVLETQGGAADCTSFEETEALTDVGLPDASFTTELYSVERSNGACYVSFVNGNDIRDEEQDLLTQQLSFIFFSTVEEMYDTIRNGKLTEQQIAVIKNSFTLKEKGFVFPDVERLLTPVLPDDLQASGIGLTDDVYTYSLRSDGETLGGSVRVLSEGLYRAVYDYEYTNYFDNDNITVVSTQEGMLEGVPCEITEFRTAVAKLRMCRLQIQEEGKLFSVQIKYVIEASSSLLEASETVPSSITVYYEEDGRYLEIYLHDFEELPSVHWITSFGCEAYVPADQNASQ